MKCSEQHTEHRLGCWMSEKKCRKFAQTDFPNICRQSGLNLVQIDLSKSLEEQGPFCAILHKLTDVIVKAECLPNESDAEVQENKRIVQAFEAFLNTHPKVLMLDPIDNIRLLLDRSKTYQLIEESSLAKEDGVFSPAHVELTTTKHEENIKLLKKNQVNFPFVCKPSIAHGSKLAHKMAVIFNEDGVKDISPPCVAQTFVCHNAVLYKLFALGDKWFQVERPSLKNFHSGDYSTIFFDSHDVSKAKADTALNQLDEADVGTPVPKPSQVKFRRIVETLRKLLGMALFGVDVVIESRTGKYAIIDINIFPGYDGVPDFNSILVDYINQQLEVICGNVSSLSSAETITATTTTTTSSTIATTTPESESGGVDVNQEDSGIETGDSSDEKKNKKNIFAKSTKRHQRNACAQTLIATTKDSS